MIRLSKQSDISFILDARDAQGFPFRLKNCDEFTFKFFTRDCGENTVYIEAGYKDGETKNVIIGQNADEICLQKADVSTLPSGVLKCTYYYKVVNEKMSDGYYDESNTIETNIILK